MNDNSINKDKGSDTLLVSGSRQNIYDTDQFYKSYEELTNKTVQFKKGLSIDMVEKDIPTYGIQSPSSPQSLENIVDLGCGDGWFSKYMAVERNAKMIKSYDQSVNMINNAKDNNAHPSIEYILADLETLQLPKQQFDLAHSSLVLHYIVNIPTLFRTIFESLKPGGYFITNIEHPIYTAPTYRQWIKTRLPQEEGERLIWPFYDYYSEGDRVVDWLVKGVLKQHRTVSTWMNHFIDAGFNIRHVKEISPEKGEVVTSTETHNPMFLLLVVQKPPLSQPA